MSRYFVDVDGADEPTIWEATDADPIPAVVVRRAELPGPRADLLWRVLTGVLTADDETVERVARALWADRIPRPVWNDYKAEYIADAHATLAALREVQ